MAEPNEPEAVLPQGYQVGTIVVSPLPAKRAYPLGNDDFLTLCDGTSGDERAGRDLYMGLFVSAIVGIAGVITSVDWTTVFSKPRWAPILCLLLLTTLAAVSVMGCILHWTRMRREDTPYTRLKKSISEFFQD